MERSALVAPAPVVPVTAAARAAAVVLSKNPILKASSGNWKGPFVMNSQICLKKTSDYGMLI